MSFIVLANLARHELDRRFTPPPVVQADTVVWQQAENGSSYKKDSAGYETSDGYGGRAGGVSYGNERKDFARNEKSRYGNDSIRWGSDTAGDSAWVMRYSFQEKLPFGTVVDINTADTTLLKGVPGIGSYFANRIVEYRARLGGFADVRQLAEVRNLPDSVQGWFTTGDSVDVVRIAVNECSIQQLMAHPYISFYQARAIMEFRHAHGEIDSPGQLSMLPEFSDTDMERLLPYLSF